jgi:hypothetical protein
MRNHKRKTIPSSFILHLSTPNYLATSVNRVSRSTVTLISPG